MDEIKSPVKAIRTFCLDCCGGNSDAFICGKLILKIIRRNSIRNQEGMGIGMKYIELDSAIENVVDQMRCSHSVICMVERLQNMDTADVVARDCFDRILKENDVMREQLASIGKKPGDSMNDVQRIAFGEWQERYIDDDPYDKFGIFRRRFYCSSCGTWQTYGKINYCPSCGANMEVK